MADFSSKMDDVSSKLHVSKVMDNGSVQAVDNQVGEGEEDGGKDGRGGVEGGAQRGGAQRWV